MIGWNAAFLYDSNVGAETAIQLLEYANSQLLEFRHYDDLLTPGTCRRLRLPRTRRGGIFRRWRTAREANQACTQFWLDVNELTERADNAIKFLSDMFSARLYKLAAAKDRRSRLQDARQPEASHRGRASTASWWTSSIKAARSCSSSWSS